MKIRLSEKRAILGVFTALLGLLAFMTLCIPLIKTKVADAYDSGFNLLDFSSNVGIDSEVEYLFGALAIVQLILSCITVVISVLAIFFLDYKTAKRIFLGFGICCYIMIFVYAVEGIAYSLGNNFSDFVNGEWVEIRYTTFSYVGFIIGTVLFTALLCCHILIPADTKAADGTDETAIKINRANAAGGALKLYKELMDDGAITQEEFDKKKEELLNL